MFGPKVTYLVTWYYGHAYDTGKIYSPSVTLSWFGTNQFVLLLLIDVCLAEKHHTLL